MLSVLINALNCILILGCIAAAMRTADDKKVVFRYFTVLSNLLCAAASAAVAAARIAGQLSQETAAAAGQLSPGISVFKFAATCAVTVTLLTVVFFLAPTMGGIAELIKGFNLFLHLLCPLLAIVSYLLWDKVKTGAWSIVLGVLPVLLYGGLYLYKVLLAPEGKRWDDFYGFNRGGRWPVSLAAMLAGSLIISLALWFLA